MTATSAPASVRAPEPEGLRQAPLEMRRIFEAQRQGYRADINPSYAVRKDRLRRLLYMTERHAGDIASAVSTDFGHRSVHETMLGDIGLTIAAIKHNLRHLRKWMKTRRAPTAMRFRPGFSRLMRQPLGVVGIVSPWNYPYLLSMGPVVGAVAAGNRVMLKPSEHTPRFAELFRTMVRNTFGEDEFTVITGDASVGKAFVELPFDHLLFTGSTHVGRQVAQAAAKNLTPVTLELGGKSPAIVDRSADVDAIAARLAFSKLFNAGQTCMAPDYALVPRASVEAFAAAMVDAISRLYPEVDSNPDYTSIVNDRHFARLRGLLDDAHDKGGRIVQVNASNERGDPAGRKLTPTLVLDAHEGMALMQGEIFGPILPIVAYDTLDDAIRYVNERDRPLALYWFGKDSANRDRVLRETISGGVTVNDCIWHFGQEDLPFGGVGASGIGAIKGEYGFRTFSKEKPVFFQPMRNVTFLLHPPYGRTFERIVALLKRLS